jgi:hypothetical protein
MSRVYRRQLCVRDPHPDRRNPGYSVGYWDRPTRKSLGDPDRDFRCFGVCQSRDDAVKLAAKIAVDRPYEFKF